MYNHKEAQNFLANIALEMMPRSPIESYELASPQAIELRQKVLTEIYNKLKISSNDNSDRAKSMVYQYISNTLSKLSLGDADINKIKNRVGQKGLLRNDSYNIEFRDYFNNEILPLGIRQSHVRDAIHNPDLVSHFSPDLFGGISDKYVSLYLKTPKVTKIDDIFSILVLTDRMGATQIVMDAWRVYHANVDISKCVTALDVLQSLIGKYGIEITVGSKTSKFILYEKIDMPSKEDKHDFLKINNIEKDTKFTVRCLIRANDNPPSIEIAIAFCINMDRYIADLTKH